MSLEDESPRLDYNPNLSSQRFDSAHFESFTGYTESESMREGSIEEDLPYGAGDIVDEAQSPPPPSTVFSESKENGPILPSPVDMLPEEGVALREWRRQNAIRLEEKEKREKEMLKEIIDEADEYKAEYCKKWKIRCENSRDANREKEKLALESREKFHAEANKNYWKSIAELIPKEVPVIEKKGKKGREKQPSIVVIQGPKPGKPTDLSRMRQVLVKLKHKPPPHMTPPPLPPEPGKEAKTAASPPVAISAKSPTVSKPEAVSVVAK
ncbi:Clathrin light chain 3 [Abeliophyllum distichum]|uniref:Clathrin light chain n=1 Tax=Abeliophyllum distichum TaxID=126358 RepID=A0ABD1QYT8_9LAMI